MPRFSYADSARLPPRVLEILRQSPLNVMRMLAGASEDVFIGFGQFSGSFYMGTTLDPVLREIAILRVGYVSNSRYETWQHEVAARTLKMSEAQIAAIKQGGKHPTLFSEEQQSVLDFADELTTKVRASDAVLAAVRKFLSDALVLDLILLIGCYMTVCRILETTGVEMDERPQDWGRAYGEIKALKDR
jgi:4-carboxymuconolactone decarboxylase